MNQSPTWHDVIGEEKKQSYFVDTLNFVEAERAAGKAIFPPAKDVFNAFRFTEFNDVKVVILGGQDHTMVQIRRMVCAFPFFLESKRHRHSLICIKSWLKILKGSKSLSMDSYKAGQSKVYCCSIQY